MAYEDLKLAEKIAFHDAIIEKHQQCRHRLNQQYETPEEGAAQSAKVATLMGKDVTADEFKAVEEVGDVNP